MGAARSGIDEAMPPVDTPTTMRVAPTRWGTNEQRRVAWCQAEQSQTPTDGKALSAPGPSDQGRHDPVGAGAPCTSGNGLG